MNKNLAKNVLIILIFSTLLTPFLVWNSLLFPFVTAKALWIRGLVLLGLPFYIYLIFIEKNLRPSLKNPINISIIVFLLVSLIAAIFGINFQRSFWGNAERMGGAWHLIHLILLYFYIIGIGKESPKVLKTFFEWLVYFATVAALYGIAVYFQMFGFKDPAFPRISTTFGNPIFFASFLVFPIFLSSFFALREENNTKKWLFWACVCCMLLATFLTGTRGALVGLVIGLFVGGIFFVFLSPNKKLKKYTLAVLSFLILAFAVAVFYGLNNSQRSILNLNDSNTQSRLIQWKMAVEGFKEKPFLGVGPENYWFISNKYYNPELWKFDASWFDKPHNYQLEILSTSGLLGLGSYLTLFFVCLWALYFAFKKQILDLIEFCIFSSAVVMYQIQNLFVFDTIAASLVFFAFLGFVSFLYESSLDPDPKEQNKKSNKPQSFNWLFVITSLVSVYCFYATVLVGYGILKKINFGHIYSETVGGHLQAKEYFDSVDGMPFNFYVYDWAFEYSKFAARLAEKQGQDVPKDFMESVLDRALFLSKKSMSQNNLEPQVYLTFANLQNVNSIYRKTNFTQEATNSGLKAHELAPKRAEPLMFLAVNYIRQDNLKEAEKWLKQILQNIPLHKEAKWQLAAVYYFSERQTEASSIAVNMLQEGYPIENANKMDWLIEYFNKSQKFQESVDAIQLAVKNSTPNADLYARLADAAVRAKNKALAKNSAEQAVIFNPQLKDSVDKFLIELDQKLP